MSHSANELLVLAEKFEKIAKDKPKLDPKAKVRNRGTVCVPASSAKDKKDHFPINSESQARNALARVHQYSSAPSWYSGSLKGLQDLVSRKVHSKYPSIGKNKKSSEADYLMKKYATGLTEWAYLIGGYPNKGDMLGDISEAMKMSAYKEFPNAGDPDNDKALELVLKQAELFVKIYPEMAALDQQLEAMASPIDRLLKKYAGVPELTKVLEHYEGTAALLRDLAVCQFTIGGNDPNDTSEENYETNKKLHDMIMALAAQIEPIEQTMW